MFWNFFELQTFYTNLGLKKRLIHYALRFMKHAFKMAFEDPKKILLKSTQNMILSAVFKALTTYPTNFLRPLFDSQFFLSIYFYFGHNTPWCLETWEN